MGRHHWRPLSRAGDTYPAGRGLCLAVGDDVASGFRLGEVAALKPGDQQDMVNCQRYSQNALRWRASQVLTVDSVVPPAFTCDCGATGAMSDVDEIAEQLRGWSYREG